MGRPTVYLAGPINGCDEDEAKGWRFDAADVLRAFHIRSVSPLRCEPIVGERYSVSYADPKFGSPGAIAAKNLFDVRRCDMVLAYLPRELTERKPSYGTIIEMGWAHMLGKPVVLVTDDPALREHPVVQACAGWVLDNLDDGLDVVTGILEVYA